MAQSRRIEFAGALGETLAARLELPHGQPRAFALFAHCFSCSKDILAASRIARRLTGSGFAVLRFDFTGLGQSDGDFANTNFSSNIADLIAAADYLDAEYEAPALLIGHSLGGAAVIAAAGKLPSVRAVATIGAPADAAHVTQQFAADLAAIERDGVARVELAGRPFTLKKQFLDDIADHKVEDAAAGLRRPLLLLHAPTDAIVGIDNASRLFQAAKHPKSFVSLDDADHLLGDVKDALYAADTIAAWAGRYVPEARSEPPAAAGESVVVVRETGGGRFENHVVVGDHVMLADEPASVGGLDAGPSPYGYLSAALGACTSMTLRMYANRKGLPLDRVTVSTGHHKGHAEDCADCVDGQERHVDIFEREITLEGELDGDQKARLLEIADKCPVHRTLHSPVVVRTRLKDDG
ncbi:bifunctional alpha/beta hydrolase/OsmC family protein [Maricaulis sp.]|uniref:bifunctional alpha/beta hydrolase/OsmC family protein n=1 Tax=Maricaulis sp. TaxID=1486257 RepID=UPI002B27413D|nr:bifunctional alpha/beta hydrolase/OsmC family protein [Maricaulis sp.]